MRITHLPTKIVVQNQNERSQAANKQAAMRLLRSRLAELGEEQREEELASERGVAQNTGFGSQIRSYVLHPYQLVKDLRTATRPATHRRARRRPRRLHPRIPARQATEKSLG